jgi:hypothetical protein
MSLSVREKILVYLLVIAVIVFIGVKYLDMPAVRANNADSARAENLLTQQDTAQQKVVAVQNSSSSLEKALASANSAASSLLPQPDIDLLNVWVVNLVQSSGLNVTSISFTQPSSTDVGASSTTQNGTSSAINQDYLLGQYAKGYKGEISNPSATSENNSTSSSAATTSGAIGGVLGVNVTMALTGNYNQAKAFLDIVKNSGKTVIVTSFGCSVSGSTYSINATLQCFGAEKPDSSDGTFNWTLPKPAGAGNVM